MITIGISLTEKLWAAMNIRKFNDEVFYTTNDLTTVNTDDIAFLKAIGAKSSRKRARLCVHKDNSDSLHEMLIFLGRDSYIRPHKHANKSESFHMVEGQLVVIMFDEHGNILRTIFMGEYSNNQVFYCRFAGDCFHSVVVLSEFAIFHETTNGPFHPDDTAYASWAPDEKDSEAKSKYLDSMSIFLNGLQNQKRNNSMKKKLCRVCGKAGLSRVLDLGNQPISNRFLQQKNTAEKLYPLQLGFCDSCATIQLKDPIAYSRVIPPYDWIKYNEPEAHLDKLVRTITRLPGVASNAKILGLSYKDDSTLARLNKLGHAESYRLHLKDDLGVRQAGRAGVESIQHCLTPDLAKTIALSKGRSNIVIARHILEHAHQPIRFMQALMELVEVNSYLVIEVPDEQRAFRLKDVMIAWEEHVVYFTPWTFANFFTHFNCRIIKQLSYKYPLENSLIMILQKKKNNQMPLLTAKETKAEKQRFEKFARSVSENMVYYHELLKKYKRQNKKIALLGASHLTIKFVNIYGLSDYIEFVVDDSINKQSYLMPGSKLKILPSTALLEKKIHLCLIGVNPGIEEKIIRSNAEFLRSGGKFYSIFHSSRLAL